MFPGVVCINEVDDPELLLHVLVLCISLTPPLEVYLLREDQLRIPPHQTSHAAVKCNVELFLMAVGVDAERD